MPFAANGTLFYRMTGSGANTLVFLHGAGGSGLIFGNQFQAFREEARCYFVDLPGHGASVRLPVDSLQAYTGSVVDFIAGLNRPVDLLGHSMGGAIAIEIALSRPHLLRNLVLVGTACRFPVSGTILNWLDEDYELALDRITRYCFSESVDANVVKTARTQMATVPPDIMRSDFLACSLFDRCGRLREIRVPTLVICGEQDRMTPVDLSRELVDSLPNATLEVIPAGSHLVMLEQPEAFNKRISAFL